MKLVKIVALSCLTTMLASPIVSSAARILVGGETDLTDKITTTDSAKRYSFYVGDGQQVTVSFVPFTGTLANYTAKNPDTITFSAASGEKPSIKLATFSNFLAKGLGIQIAQLQQAAGGVAIISDDYVAYALPSLGFEYMNGAYCVQLQGKNLKQVQAWVASLSKNETATLDDMFTATIDNGKEAVSTNFELVGDWTAITTLIVKPAS